jgi:hypothetical protein
VAREAKVCKDNISEKGKRAFPRLEISHQGHEGVALLDDLEEVVVDLDGMATSSDVTVDIYGPGIGREAELPLAGRRRGLD